MFTHERLSLAVDLPERGKTVTDIENYLIYARADPVLSERFPLNPFLTGKHNPLNPFLTGKHNALNPFLTGKYNLFDSFPR